MPVRVTLHLNKRPDDSTEAGMVRTEVFEREASVDRIRVQYPPNGGTVLLGEGKWVGISPDVSHWSMEAVKASDIATHEGEHAKDVDLGALKVDKRDLEHLNRVLAIYEDNYGYELAKDPERKSTQGRLTRAVERLSNKVR